MEHYATLDGRSIRYHDTGAGPVLVLLHAFPLNADLWLPQLVAAPPGWRLIAPDLRGFGGSSRTVSDGEHLVAVPARAVDDYARDVLALLDHLGVTAAAIGGLSMGGYVAFAIRRLASDRVRALVLADTRAEADSVEGRTNRERMLASLDQAGPAAVADTMVPKLLGPDTLRDRPELAARLRQTILATDREAIADAIRCMMTRPDSTPLLDGLDIPVLLLVGRDDELTPVVLHEQMQARLPQASLTIIERAGHLPNLEQSDVFNRSLERFLGLLA